MQFLLFYKLKVCLGKYSSFADGFFIRQPKTEREAPLYKPLVLNSWNGNIHTMQKRSLLSGPESWFLFLSLI